MVSQIIENFLVFLCVYLELRSRVSARSPTKNEKKVQKYPIKNLFSSRYFNFNEIYHLFQRNTLYPFLWHLKVLLSNARPYEAIKLIMNDAAKKCLSFSGSYPSSDITPAPSPATCLNAQLSAALPKSRVQVWGSKINILKLNLRISTLKWGNDNVEPFVSLSLALCFNSNALPKPPSVIGIVTIRRLHLRWLFKIKTTIKTTISHLQNSLLPPRWLV